MTHYRYTHGKTCGYGNSWVQVTCDHKSTWICVLVRCAASTCHRYLQDYGIFIFTNLIHYLLYYSTFVNDMHVTVKHSHANSPHSHNIVWLHLLPPGVAAAKAAMF